MKHLKYFVDILFLAAIISIHLLSCTSEDFTASKINSKNGLNLTVSVNDFGNKTLVRANSERTDMSLINDMNVILVSNDNTISKIIFVDKNSESVGENSTETGLVENNLGSTSELKFHISKEDLNGITAIYVLSNFDDNQSVISLKNQKVDNLLSLTSSNIGNSNYTTLFGQVDFSSESGLDAHNGKIVSVSLRRLIAMVTIQMRADGLKEGITIQPNSIRLHNISTSCTLRDGNEAVDSQLGPDYPINWGGLSVQNSVIGGHDKYETLYLFENKQGEGTYNEGLDGPGGDYSHEIGKTPPSGKEDKCTYLEIIATYTYNPPSGGVKFISGTIKYRLWLGNDIYTNFDVTRNTHYKVTLTLKGMGGLYEDGKTDKDGNFIVDYHDLSWRIDADGVSEGGTFIGDELNVASNGFYAYVPFKMEPGKTYEIIHDGSGTVSWLWTYNGSYWDSPNNSQPKQYSGKELNDKLGLDLDPDLQYIKLFVQSWTDEAWKTYVPNVKDLDSWITDGFREGVLVLKESKKEVGRMKIRQWLPMPVLENGNKDPFNAEMYFSRIDVYQGVALPWGPQELNEVNLDNTNTNGLYFYNSVNYVERDYNPAFGFDKCVSIYHTDRLKDKNIKFNQDDGRPNDALRVALFRAHCANSGTTGPKFPDPDSYQLDFYKIGLPSVEEWIKIKKMGVVDPKFPIAPDEYWTSTVDGTYSKTYSFFDGNEGSSRSAFRSEKHRTRLIYHKLDYGKSLK